MRGSEDVTFFFTDVEGSTRLWENFPEQMRAAIARHDLLLSRIIEENSGQIFKTAGDAFYATFSSPVQAAACAAAVQRAFSKEPWPSPISLKVRVVLHAGRIEERKGEYFGPEANHAFRLLSAAHGGQTLLSSAAAGQIEDLLPERLYLRDLGMFRLRHSSAPEQVYQLGIPGLPSDFPPLRSLEAFAHNLPVQSTRFIGREKETAEVVRLLSGTRLLTLTGAGGCGKTRLALRVAGEMLDRFPDGAWFVDLGPVSDSSLVAKTVALSLGMREEAGRPILSTLIDYLHAKTVLVLLDNCEHLVTACVELAEALLRSCPDLRVLATSREALEGAGETVWRVPSLAFPDPEEFADFESARNYEAVQLFLDRAKQSDSDFDMTDKNLPLILRLCSQLDGIPLAIELAASRLGDLPLNEILAGLQDRFKLLQRVEGLALPRHQTLRGALDWSHALLSQKEQVLLRRLSVFSGGFSLEAVEQVCQGKGIEVFDLLDLLAGLINKSLVMVEEGAGEMSRYKLLETVRQYGEEKLADSGEMEPVFQRHLKFYLEFAQEAELLISGPGQATNLQLLEQEQDNFRGVLDRCSAGKLSARDGLRLSAALWNFWRIRGHFTEGRDRLLKAIESADRQHPDRSLPRALLGAGVLCDAQGDFEKAWELLESSLKISLGSRDPLGVANALRELGSVALSKGDYSKAKKLLDESLSQSRKLSDARGIAAALNLFGHVAFQEGDPGTARARFEESLSYFQNLGDSGQTARLQANLGLMALEEGDHASARSLFQECLRVYEDLKDKPSMMPVLQNLGIVALILEDLPEAEKFFNQGLALSRELGAKSWAASFLASLGVVLVDLGEIGEGKREIQKGLSIFREFKDIPWIAWCLGGIALAELKQGNHSLSPLLLGLQAQLLENKDFSFSSFDLSMYEKWAKRSQGAIPSGQFHQIFARGKTLSLEQGIRYALGEDQL